MKLKRKILLDNLEQYKIIEGPKKTYRKFLEKQNFCRIFVRGKDTKEPGELIIIGTREIDEEEDTHILVISDSLQAL